MESDLTDPTDRIHLEQARLARLNDLLQLEDMAGDETDYLAHVAEIEDDESGLECSFEEKTG
jgi:hypothetical protein